MPPAKPRPDIWMLALERAKLGAWDWNLATGDCYYSPTWLAMLGYAENELSAHEDLWLDLIHPDDRHQAIGSGERHLAGLAPLIETEMRLRHRDGSYRWVLDRGGVVERGSDGRALRMVGVQTDITDQKKLEEELSRLNERFRLALSASGTGIWSHDLSTGATEWDQRTREIFLACEEDHNPARNWEACLHPDDRASVVDAFAQRKLQTTVGRLTYRILRPDGVVRHVETLSCVVRTAPGAEKLIGTIRDVTEDVEKSQSLELEKERLRVTLRSIRDAVLTTNASGHLAFVNRSALALFGWAEDQVLGRLLNELIPELVEFNKIAESQVINYRSSVLQVAVSPIRTATDEAKGQVFIIRDVSEDVAREKALIHAAFHDDLTGLLNRTAFEERLSEKLKSVDTAAFSLLYIDLDHFKALNDFAGHAAGDEALKTIASILTSHLPEGSVVARLGGDEFAALVDVVSPQNVRDHANAVIRAIYKSQARTPDGRSRPKVGASIGISIIDEMNLSPSEAMARGDDACYAAKNSGRNRCVLFDGRPSTSTHGLTAASLASEVLNALEDDRLLLYGQRILPLRVGDNAAQRVEILSRLQTRSGALVPPDRFIAAAQRFGIAARIDRHVIAKVLQQYGHLMHNCSELVMGINLSAQTLSDPSLWSYVDDLLGSTRVAGSNLIFEITETAAIANLELAYDFVIQAKKRNCMVSLDDFGAGLSSFEYLKRFPVDSFKINGSFIQNLANDRFDQAFVKAMCDVAKTVGYKVVAEKIEDRAALDQLVELGVDYGQGFLLHRPEPLDMLLSGTMSEPTALQAESVAHSSGN